MWYAINNDYITEINEFIQNIDFCPLQFHDYDVSIHTCENDYNESVAKSREDVISMDKKLINIDRSRFELCDLLSKEKHLIHVKPWSSSSTLSHLFSQGRISAKTIINVPKIIPQINEKIEEQGGNEKYYLDTNQNYTVVYAIIYEGEQEIHERIPFFSKLNFVHSVRTLKSMRFNVQKMHIRKINTKRSESSKGGLVLSDFS